MNEHISAKGIRSVFCLGIISAVCFLQIGCSTLRYCEEPKEGQNIVIGGELAIEMAWVSPGTLLIGSTTPGTYPTWFGGDAYEEPQRNVMISTGYWIGKTEVTIRQYELLTGRDTGYSSPNRPVHTISWWDVYRFCSLLTKQEQDAGRLPKGYAYRLPTEVEWEFAARGGIHSKGYIYSGSDDIDSVAWHAGGGVKDVGMLKPNELGLFDMSGNVWEWTHDWFQEDNDSIPRTNSDGPRENKYRVKRGGSVAHGHVNCRIERRMKMTPLYPGSYLGFRVVLGVPIDE